LFVYSKNNRLRAGFFDENFKDERNIMAIPLEQPVIKHYTGDEALEIVKKYQVYENFTVENLRDELPSFAHYLQRIGNNALSLARADDNAAGTFKGAGAMVGAHAFMEAGIEDILVPSAGNHARGGVLAANALGLRAHIVVPETAPPAKKEGLRQLGECNIHAVGESFDEALAWANQHAELGTSLHPFDDPNVITGQGTLLDYMLAHADTPIDHIVVPVGGGGLAAGIAQRLGELKNSSTHLHVVEATGSHSLSRSLEAGEPTAVEHPNVRYGGSAVRKIGRRSFEILQRFRKQERLHLHHIDEESVDALISDYTFDRSINHRTTTPSIEPTSLVAIAAVERIHRQYRDAHIMAVATGRNAPLETTTPKQRH
jgi:threonine dehydratase